MAVKHLKSGENFFDARFMPEHQEFGFKGSIPDSDRPVMPDRKGKASPPFAADEPTAGPNHGQQVGGGNYAHGGAAHHAHGGMPHMHPHGHEPIGEMMPHAMGGMCQRHAHGGMTVHHSDGRQTHHMFDGSPVPMHGMRHGGHHMAEGGMVAEGNQTYERAGHGAPPYGTEMHPSEGGQFDAIHPDSPPTANSNSGPGYAKGGDAHEKGLIKKAFREHDHHMHDGHSETIKLAGGGMRPSLPRGMRPVAARHHSEIGNEMPINKPPRNPNHTMSPRGEMPGGVMGYGNQPSAEPDDAGSEQGISGMRKGGHHRRD